VGDRDVSDEGRVEDKATRQQKCPICGKPATPEHLPFCSRRCANVDLNRWLTGAYAIPGRTASGEDDDAELAEDRRPPPSKPGD
jgi:endogenous inhibitor of DNA gyrase (YacG/DUF329 family)